MVKRILAAGTALVVTILGVAAYGLFFKDTRRLPFINK